MRRRFFLPAALCLTVSLDGQVMGFVPKPRPA